MKKSNSWLSQIPMRTLVRSLILVVAAGLAGCTTTVPTETYAEMTFRHLPQIQLLVSDIKIESTAPQSTEPPYIGHLLPTSPDTAIRNWARDRLVARGSGAKAVFTIVRADATGQALAKDTGFTGLFKQELSDRYEGHIDAVLTIYDANGQRRAHVEAKAEHATTVREDSTLADRHKIMYDLVEKMMADFNVEMERNIRTYLRDFAL